MINAWPQLSVMATSNSDAREMDDMEANSNGLLVMKHRMAKKNFINVMMELKIMMIGELLNRNYIYSQNYDIIG